MERAEKSVCVRWDVAKSLSDATSSYGGVVFGVDVFGNVPLSSLAPFAALKRHTELHS